jgi:hypothetical protein
VGILWQLSLDQLRTWGHTREPDGADRQRVRWVLWELHLLGERPSPDELRRYGGVDGKPTSWSREIAGLWTERQKHPHRVVRGSSPWAYPFAVPSSVIDAHNLRPGIGERLAAELARKAEQYAEAVARSGPAEELERLDDELHLAARALRLWCQTRVAWRDHDRDVVGGTLSLPRPQRRLIYLRVPDPLDAELAGLGIVEGSYDDEPTVEVTMLVAGDEDQETRL